MMAVGSVFPRDDDCDEGIGGGDGDNEVKKSKTEGKNEASKGGKEKPEKKKKDPNAPKGATLYSIYSI